MPDHPPRARKPVAVMAARQSEKNTFSYQVIVLKILKVLKELERATK